MGTPGPRAAAGEQPPDPAAQPTVRAGNGSPGAHAQPRTPHVTPSRDTRMRPSDRHTPRPSCAADLPGVGFASALRPVSMDPARGGGRAALSRARVRAPAPQPGVRVAQVRPTPPLLPRGLHSCGLALPEGPALPGGCTVGPASVSPLSPASGSGCLAAAHGGPVRSSLQGCHTAPRGGECKPGAAAPAPPQGPCRSAPPASPGPPPGRTVAPEHCLRFHSGLPAPADAGPQVTGSPRAVGADTCRGTPSPSRPGRTWAGTSCFQPHPHRQDHVHPIRWARSAHPSPQASRNPAPGASGPQRRHPR